MPQFWHATASRTNPCIDIGRTGVILTGLAPIHAPSS
jgi:hypothetical protein